MNRKILVVDDDSATLQIIEAAFKGSYEIHTALDGVAAMEIAKKEEPFLVFLDIAMPKISGIEVLQQLKESGLKPVVWMLTGAVELDIVMQAMEKGASGYITKPFSLDVMRRVAANAERQLGRNGKPDSTWRGPDPG